MAYKFTITADSIEDAKDKLDTLQTAINTGETEGLSELLLHETLYDQGGDVEVERID